MIGRATGHLSQRLSARAPRASAWALPVALLAAAAGASAQEPSGAAAGAAAEVLELERRIEAAVRHADTGFLDGVLASDFTYTHGDGWTTGGAVRGVDHRAEWLASLAGRYSRREVDSQQVELHGDVAITMGRVRARSGALRTSSAPSASGTSGSTRCATAGGNTSRTGLCTAPYTRPARPRADRPAGAIYCI